jgi:hypothetical protein
MVNLSKLSSRFFPNATGTKKTILETVSAYYLKKGYDYVARNVLYTNQCCTDNYRAYLAKFLKEEWVLALQEDEEEVLFYNLSKQGKKAEMERKAMMPFRMCGNISSSYHQMNKRKSRPRQSRSYRNGHGNY